MLLPMPVEEDDTDYSLVVPGQMPDCDVEIGYFLNVRHGATDLQPRYVDGYCNLPFKTRRSMKGSHRLT